MKWHDDFHITALRNRDPIAFTASFPYRSALALTIATVAWAPAWVGAGSGNIYVSYSSDGVPRYATQPYDGTYVALIEAPTQSGPIHARKEDGRQLQLARQRLEPIIESKARKFGLDPALLRAVIHTESAFNAQAVSPKGAQGAMQILPATAARYGQSRLTDPSDNIEVGAHHLSELLKQFDGNLPLALAAYNSGEGAVGRYAKRIPPYRETMIYVPTVLARYSAYQQSDALPNSGMKKR